MSRVISIGVVGNGVVGQATARTYLGFAEVKVFDDDRRRATHSLRETVDCDVVFLCLPTPAGDSLLEGDARSLRSPTLDTYALHQFCESVAGHQGVLVLKSTVPVGTTAALRRRYGLPHLLHSPEFLTARCSFVDAVVPARHVIGGAAGAGLRLLADVYRERFPGVPVHLMSSDESEAVKLICNAFFAVKVSFFNEARTLVDGIGADWPAVLKAVLADGRIAHSHTEVPGHDGLWGFGGACLPKDLGCLVGDLERRGLPADVCRGALTRNAADRGRGVCTDGEKEVRP